MNEKRERLIKLSKKKKGSTEKKEKERKLTKNSFPKKARKIIQRKERDQTEKKMYPEKKENDNTQAIRKRGEK